MFASDHQHKEFSVAELQVFAGSEFISQFLFSLVLTLLLLLVSRAVVAQTRYSSVIIVIVFALGMGVVLTRSGLTTAGIPELPLLNLLSRSTLIALIPIFFIGGQELRKIFGDIPYIKDEINTPSKIEVFYGTTTSQLTLLTRSFFLLIGIAGIKGLLLGYPANDPLARFYPLIGYISLISSLVIIDSKAIVQCRRQYVQRGIVEIFLILAIMIVANSLSVWQGNTISLPEILFIVMISTMLGGTMYSWQSGATFRALFYGGLPVALTASFIIGGSWMEGAFVSFDEIDRSFIGILTYGFFGQLFWIFGGMSLLIYIGHNRHIRNIVAGLSGALSHIGLLAAATAHEMGSIARTRAPIMTIITIFSYLLVTIVDRISLGSPHRIIIASILVILFGILITARSLWILKQSEDLETDEVRAIMLFSFGWQVIAIFSGILLLQIIEIKADFGTLAYSPSLSHIGLFAIFQEGMIHNMAGNITPFVYAMPFLAHPILFWVLGHAMNNRESLSTVASRITLTLACLGLTGIIISGFLILI